MCDFQRFFSTPCGILFAYAKGSNLTVSPSFGRGIGSICHSGA
jgi:hypothetical protein